MNSHCSCHAPAAQQEGSRPISSLRRFRSGVQWAVPGAILVAMPKCPACVAAYLVLFTGMSVSLSTAAHLRVLALVLCIATLAFLAVKRAARRRRIAQET